MRKKFCDLYRESGIQRKKFIEVFNINPNSFDKMVQGELKLPEDKADNMRAYLKSIISMNKMYSKLTKENNND